MRIHPLRPKPAQPRPSDWAPVPIPQPAEALHTSDPETPMLRQLAERERQRTSLAREAPAPLDAPAPAQDPHFPPGLPADLNAPGACRGAWAAFGREAQGVLQVGGPGDGDADPIARNRAISQAYADFYQRRGLEWAGIASIVSSNAGCAMRAADAVRADANRQAHDLIEARRFMPPIDGDGGGEFVTPAGRDWAAAVAHDALAKGNKAIFGDVYPVLRAGPKTWRG